MDLCQKPGQARFGNFGKFFKIILSKAILARLLYSFTYPFALCFNPWKPETIIFRRYVQKFILLYWI